MKYLVLALVFTSLAGFTEAVCNYHGQTYTTGQGFASDDGCNRCNCLASGMAACTKIFCGQKTCQYHGHTHQVGEGFRSVDGCNHCTCTAFGVACTEIFCVSTTTAAVGCTENGHFYRNGQSFPSSDGCNTCGCSMGMVTCTAMACI